MALLPKISRSRWLRAGLCLLAGLPAGLTRATAAPETPATLIVLDASGSMRSRIKAKAGQKRERRIEIARRVVRELVESLPGDTRLGLVVYGHRKNECSDIELLIPPGPLDKPAFVKAVDALRPRGRTPISASLQFSADALQYRQHRANIVLISDGAETCGPDPCDTARLLSRDAAGLTIHTVGFDLSAHEAESLECAALATGGRYFAADDAASLRDALELAIGEIRLIQTSAATPAAAMLKAPEKVFAGMPFQAEWSGPNGPGDYLAAVLAKTPDGMYRQVTYTERGSPAQVQAPEQPGAAELRYVSASSRTVLARLEIEVLPPQVRLTAPDEASPGSRVSIEWSGPGQAEDYITIVPRNAPDELSTQTAGTRSGSPVSLTVPVEPGDCEIRYISGGPRREVLARRLLRVTGELTLRVPGSAQAGATIAVEWTGPNGPGDFITIVPKAYVDGRFAAHVFTAKGSPAKIAVPPTAGPWEVRYMRGQDNQVLARTPLSMGAPELKK